MTDREALHARCIELIDALQNGGRDDATRDALLTDLARYQSKHVAPYGRLCRARGVQDESSLQDFPALPTDVYRFDRISSRPDSEDVRTFRSSGTTRSERSLHPIQDLSLYDHSARAAAQYALFPDIGEIPLVVLAPSEREQPDSSLSYMFARFGDWFGQGPNHYVWKDGALQLDALCEVLEAQNGPVAMLGTSFAFVHALDALGTRRFHLHGGSRILQTGGFKGRSREIEPDRLRLDLSLQFGVPDPWIVSEYGMTELCSQMYETTLRDAALFRSVKPRQLWVPGWVRATAVDPETLAPTDGVGVLRVDDIANLDSVSCVQTADLAERKGDGVVLLGRAPGATPRGCSLSADQALGTGE